MGPAQYLAGLLLMLAAIPAASNPPLQLYVALTPTGGTLVP
jgi:hypothetical protein